VDSVAAFIAELERLKALVIRPSELWTAPTIHAAPLEEPVTSPSHGNDR
jgi:hypothetical protein